MGRLVWVMYVLLLTVKRYLYMIFQIALPPKFHWAKVVKIFYFWVGLGWVKLGKVRLVKGRLS